MAGTVLLEARPYRPFKSSEEYLYAMREDLAEWLNTLYPELLINVDNFMDRLDTGVALCKHANNVRKAAEEYMVRRQARQKSMTRSMTTGLAGPILSMSNVHYLPAAKCGTFFARDNVSNFIAWCRNCLQIFECLLFETDDLIMRKNEKHVILCLLEVARRGAKFGMLAPMLIQMERQIDREIAADNKANCTTQTDITQTTSTGTENEFDSDSEEEDNNDAILMYGPQPQIVTNDLKSLDEMVRDLVEKCTCPSQFPMIRVSEGKYRIGDTKVLIFVRILRSHVMVRVGGGWDTLSHYLDKHDPCRCRAQHRSSVAAKLFTRTNQQNGIELHKAQVVYERGVQERSPPASRKFSTGNAGSNAVQSNGHLSSTVAARNNRSRSRSPALRKSIPVQNAAESSQEKSSLSATASPALSRRSISPSPRRISDMKKKQNSLEATTTTTHDSSIQIPLSQPQQPESSPEPSVVAAVNEVAKVEMSVGTTTTTNNDGANKYENVSDNGSEISDEGYRSLGLIQSGNAKRISVHSQASNEDAETNGRLDRNSPDMTTTASEETTISELKADSPISDIIDPVKEMETKFAKCGIVMNDDEISVDIASATGLRKTDFSEVLYEDNPIIAARKAAASRIPKSPLMTRRKSMENCSLTEKNEDDSLRKVSTYRSVRSKPQQHSPQHQQHQKLQSKENGTWSGRSSISPTNQSRKRPVLTSDTFKSPSRTASLTRNTPTRSSQQQQQQPRQRSSTRASSVNTSPNKSANTSQSQLAQQLLDAAGKAKNDAQILDKIKQILSDYATKNKITNDFEDFTTTWVNNNGQLADATDVCNANGSPLKSQSKRSSSVSTSSDGNPTSSAAAAAAAALTPRRIDKGLSRIPAPIRSNTGLY